MSNIFTYWRPWSLCLRPIELWEYLFKITLEYVGKLIHYFSMVTHTAMHLINRNLNLISI